MSSGACLTCQLCGENYYDDERRCNGCGRYLCPDCSAALLKCALANAREYFLDVAHRRTRNTSMDETAFDEWYNHDASDNDPSNSDAEAGSYVSDDVIDDVDAVIDDYTSPPRTPDGLVTARTEDWRPQCDPLIDADLATLCRDLRARNDSDGEAHFPACFACSHAPSVRSVFKHRELLDFLLHEQRLTRRAVKLRMRADMDARMRRLRNRGAPKADEPEPAPASATTAPEHPRRAGAVHHSPANDSRAIVPATPTPTSTSTSAAAPDSPSPKRTTNTLQSDAKRQRTSIACTSIAEDDDEIEEVDEVPSYIV